MTSEAAVDALVEALARAESGLPAGSRFPAWLARARAELLGVRRGGRIEAAQTLWLEARLQELTRELPPWPLLAVSGSPAATRLRRAGSLARRAARLVRRDGGDEALAAYLSTLGRLLFAMARGLDGNAGFYVRRGVRTLHDGFATG